jgi:hypothetical protein
MALYIPVKVLAAKCHLVDWMSIITIAEFSEALQEMGTCLLKRVTPNKDGINGNYVVSSFFYVNMLVLIIGSNT